MDMYFCGFNRFGQLGSGSLNGLTRLNLENVTDVSFSLSIAVIFAGGDTFASGFVGQKTSQFKKLTLPEKGKISQVSCSSKQTLFVTEEGQCWQYLSFDESWKKIPNFLSVENEEITSVDSFVQESSCSSEVVHTKEMMRNKVIKVSCGDVLSIALDQLGQVYSIPSPVDLGGVKVVDVACGFEHCILLDETGIVYSWGSGTRGQLGHGEPEFQDLPPRKVEILCGLKVIKISAGGWHSAVVTDTGDLYTWGWNNAGQLGFPMTKSNLRSVNQYKKTSDQIDMEYNASIKPRTRHSQQNSECCVKSGNDTRSEMPNRLIKRMKHHCFGDVSESLPTNSGEVYDSKAVAVLPEPWPVDFPSGIDVNVVDVACGNRHTAVLLDDGSPWGCGWNAHGQLGRPTDTLLYSSQMVKIPVPFDLTKVKPVAVLCGAWNTAVLVRSPDP